ncbi:TolC family protein [Deinococcus altitudinis]|uniref:TolC family protein n=1 Tax=Deinococcus altitudinis TaxID=468914 RepID=UPI003891D114
MTSRPLLPHLNLRASVLILALMSVAQAQTAPGTPAQTLPAVQASPQAVPAPAVPTQATPVQSSPAPTPVALSSFFQGLQSYPSLVQARLAVTAAQTQQAGVNFPVSGSVSGNLVDYAGVQAPPAICDTSPIALLTSPCYPVGGVGGTLNVAVYLTPLPVGDVAARQQQAAVNTTLAQLNYSSVLAGLETQALTAARRVRLSESNLALATSVQASAQQTVQTVQTRVDAGGATATDLAQAQLTLGQAQNGVQQAQEDLALARAGLRDLTGSGDAPELTTVQPPSSGTPASVVQAQLGLRRAQITQAQADWNALPTVQAGYTHYTSDSAGVGVSVDSHTLSPAINFVYGPRTPPLDRVRDQFTLGLNFTASATTLAAPGLARNGVEQAQAGLDTARRQAELQLSGLNNTLAQAQRQRAFAAQALALAQQAQQDAVSRGALGLVSPLAVTQASVAAYQAQLALGQAQLAETDATLKFFSFFALPPDGTAASR